jgi:hypothetical protein
MVVTNTFCLQPALLYCFEMEKILIYQMLLTFCLQAHIHPLLGTLQQTKPMLIHQAQLIFCLQAHPHQLVLPMRLLHISSATCSYLEAGLWQTALETCMF